MVCLQAPETLLEHLCRQRRISAVHANLCHQESFVAVALEALAEPALELSAVIFPAAIVESDAAVQAAMTRTARP
jgi:hypothetical protein